MTYEEFRKKCDFYGLTNYQVSEYSGVSKATLSQWKNGNSQPSSKTMKRLEYFIETYDPKKPDYKIVEVPYKDRDALMGIDSPKFGKTMWIDNIVVSLNKGNPITITERQYADFRKNLEIYADSWLKAHQII